MTLECSAWRRRTTSAMSAILAISAGFLLMACKTKDPGERADAMGKCPSGETCSDRTPEGLWFRGPPLVGLGSSGILPIAVGGVERVTLLRDDNPFNGRWEAQVADAAIARIEPAPASFGPATLLVRGVSSGKARLRVLEPGTQNLMDRIELKVAPIARVGVALITNAEKEEKTPRALLAGSKTLIGLAPLDESDDPLIDEAMAVSALDAPITRREWALYEVSAPSSPGSVSFNVLAGGAPFIVTIPVVAAADEIREDPASAAREPLRVGLFWNATFCFTPWSGGALLGGVTWTFEPSGPIEIVSTHPSSSPLPEGWDQVRGCVEISGKKRGQAKLTVRASGFRKDFDVLVRN